MEAEKRLVCANTVYEMGHRTPFHIGIADLCDLKELPADVPTVDAVPVVHGRWEWLGPNRLVPECMCGTCSACKVRSKYIVNTDICPNCGATMDGGTV